jgi:glycerate 2-kinase
MTGAVSTETGIRYKGNSVFMHKRKNAVKHVNDLMTIFRDAVHSVDPADLIERHVKKKGRTLLIDSHEITISEDLTKYNEIIVLGIGKASARMAQAIEGILGDDLTEGFVITKYGHGLHLVKTHVLEAGHPIPDEKSMDGARMMARIARDADEHTLIINLISGGGSSLFTLPADGISLEDKIETTRVLLASGAGIDEVNCIRKHISKVKGGRFAKIAYPARFISLILSDVIGDRLGTISSGITAPDPTTFKDALSVLAKYSLDDKVPKVVRELLSSGFQGHIPETPKGNDPVFSNAVNIIVGNNMLACKAALTRAQKLGYDTHILTTTLTGEARSAGECLSGLAMDINSGRAGLKKPTLLILGGETTVTIRGQGKGGRNQEMTLAFACALHALNPGSTNIFFLSAGTDGTDGPTDAAGAFVTPLLMEKMKGISAEAIRRLEDNDAYHFFSQQDLLFKTGPTCTNVGDIQLLMVV